ncbi:hypothetical protein AB0I28_06265 [Phytomonospora sp. NPDC050363]|uniref:hypothetical protein n=1 Tax=Phytomonospora sp. NPDC050363 TaxID=3155642 RepID=UPI0033F2B36B
MDPELETALQIAGVLAGAAGAYYAWRQYRLAKDAEPHGPYPTGEVFLTRNEFSVVPVVLGGILLFMAGYLLFNPRYTEGTTLWLDRGLALALAAMAAWAFDQNERENRVEIDGEALTIRPRGAAPVRVPWDWVKAVYIEKSDGADQLIIRTHDHGGVIPGLQPTWDAVIRPGYRACYLRDVKPSPAALRAALEKHSGGRFHD